MNFKNANLKIKYSSYNTCHMVRTQINLDQLEVLAVFQSLMHTGALCLPATSEKAAVTLN